MPFPLTPPPAFDTAAYSIPRQILRWIDKFPIRKLARTESYITIPTFNIAYTWNGYSDIVASFNFEGPNNFSLKSLPAIDTPNFFLCISWRTVSGLVYRYALIQNVGEVIFFNIPTYAGQLIKKNFRLEVWSTTQGSPAVNTTATNIYTSVLGGVDYRWGNDFQLVSNDNENDNFGFSNNGYAFALPFVWPVGSYSTANPDSTTPITIITGNQAGPTISGNVIVYNISSTQLVPYTVAPPPNPPNQNLPAFAYDPNGILPSMGWNTTTKTWQ